MSNIDFGKFLPEIEPIKLLNPSHPDELVTAFVLKKN